MLACQRMATVSKLNPLLEPLVLALIQGLTEFLPISSSAHLILVPRFFGWEDQGLTFDVATHFGSLLAVLVYFRARLAQLVLGSMRGVFQRRYNDDLQFVVKLVVATIPIVVVGALFKDFVEAELRSVVVIGITTIVFGLALLGADIVGRRSKGEGSMSMQQAFVIGMAQALAVVPGTSRSGITITVALLLGFSRETSARFSFLLAIPTIAAATWLAGMDAIGHFAHTDWSSLGLGVVVSFLSAYLCIDVFLRLVERVGLTPFVIYRLFIGSVVLGIWLFV